MLKNKVKDIKALTLKGEPKGVRVFFKDGIHYDMAVKQYASLGLSVDNLERLVLFACDDGLLRTKIELISGVEIEAIPNEKYLLQHVVFFAGDKKRKTRYKILGLALLNGGVNGEGVEKPLGVRVYTGDWGKYDISLKVAKELGIPLKSLDVLDVSEYYNIDGGHVTKEELLLAEYAEPICRSDKYLLEEIKKFVEDGCKTNKNITIVDKPPEEEEDTLSVVGAYRPYIREEHLDYLVGFHTYVQNPYADCFHRLGKNLRVYADELLRLGSLFPMRGRNKNCSGPANIIGDGRIKGMDYKWEYSGAKISGKVDGNTCHCGVVRRIVHMAFCKEMDRVLVFCSSCVVKTFNPPLEHLFLMNTIQQRLFREMIVINFTYRAGSDEEEWVTPKQLQKALGDKFEKSVIKYNPLERMRGIDYRSGIPEILGGLLLPLWEVGLGVPAYIYKHNICRSEKYFIYDRRDNYT